MKSNKIVILFVVLAIIQIAVPAQMMIKHENILQNGKVFKFRIAPVDPSNAFKGSYLDLYFYDVKLGNVTKKHWNEREEAYVIVKNSSDNYMYISELIKEKPTSSVDFIKVKINYTYNDSISISYPFNEFYMDEGKAPKAEKAYNKYVKDPAQKCYALVSVIDGDAVLKDVIINNKSIKEIK